MGVKVGDPTSMWYMWYESGQWQSKCKTCVRDTSAAAAGGLFQPSLTRLVAAFASLVFTALAALYLQLVSDRHLIRFDKTIKRQKDKKRTEIEVAASLSKLVSTWLSNDYPSQGPWIQDLESRTLSISTWVVDSWQLVHNSQNSLWDQVDVKMTRRVICITSHYQCHCQ